MLYVSAGIIYAVKWPQKWFMEESWNGVNVSYDLSEKTDFKPWFVFLTVSKWSGLLSSQMLLNFFVSSSTWLQALHSMRLLPETRHSADNAAQSFCIFDWHDSCHCIWVTSFSPLSLVFLSLHCPSLPIAFQIGWHFAPAIRLTETGNMLHSALIWAMQLKSFQQNLFFFFRKKVFIFFTFQWTGKMIMWYLTLPWHIHSLGVWQTKTSTNGLHLH